jgi:hypothetical protein
VNPYLGQTGETLAETGARLGRVAGVPVTMPRDWSMPRASPTARSPIADITDALAASADAQSLDRSTVKRWPRRRITPRPRPPTVADLAAEVSGIDWPGHHRRPVRPLGAGLFRPGSGALGCPEAARCL